MAELMSKRPVKVSFSGRSTGMGAYTQYRVFSLRQKKELKPHRTVSSRTGNHWTDYWFLLPGRYFISWKDISNSGKHRCGFGLLEVSESGYQIRKWQGEIPEFAEVCSCILEELGEVEGEW